jgi:hypothetical protein
VSAADLQLDGSYEPIGDVLYLSSPEDDRCAPAQETPEGTPSGSTPAAGSPPDRDQRTSGAIVIRLSA